MQAGPFRFKIAMLICYYGEFPWYFDYFCKSCSHNPGVDFFIFTENDAGRPLPANVRLIKKSLAEIRSIAGEKFGFRAAIDDPYKLCDLKPAYGYLFSDLIEGYDFWGHGDIDVMYGDLRGIITDELLDRNDVISGRPEYLSGFFTLFRNEPFINTLFRESKDYRRVYQDPENYCFDECNYGFASLWRGKSILEIETEVESMTYVVKKLAAEGRIRASFEMIVAEGVRQKLQWNKGVLHSTSRNRDMALYHFIEFKKLPVLFVPKWKEIPDRLFFRSYFISRHDPETPRGRMAAAFRGLARSCLFKVVYARHFMDWLGKYYHSLRRRHAVDQDQIRELTGVYRREEMRISINMRKGRLFAEWKGYPPVLLLWQKEKLFLAGKFLVQKNYNIDVEFRFDRMRSAYSLHLPLLGSGKVVLLKDKSTADE